MVAGISLSTMKRGLMNADNKVQTADYTQFEESQSRRKHRKEPLERDETKDNSYQNTGEMSIVKERE